MNLSKLKDAEVLMQIKDLVGKERHLLTQVLHHLREVEHRKLFSDLGYKSLFEYAIKELKYSEGQAGRRIQAMRLLKEIPSVEEKIKSGALTLTHLSQAQNYFREKERTEKMNPAPESKTIASKAVASQFAILSEKLELLKKMENTSSRESEKMILALNPMVLPKEKERLISPEHTEVRFVMDDSLKHSLEEVRALLGPKAIDMSFADLIGEMAKLSAATLKAKKFGKKRSHSSPSAQIQNSTPAPEQNLASGPCANGSSQRIPQGVSRRLKFLVWQRDDGKCVACASRVNLNIDHIHPKGLGGADTLENLRLLCFHCNQRRRIKTYGMKTYSTPAE